MVDGTTEEREKEDGKAKQRSEKCTENQLQYLRYPRIQFTCKLYIRDFERDMKIKISVVQVSAVLGLSLKLKHVKPKLI